MTARPTPKPPTAWQRVVMIVTGRKWYCPDPRAPWMRWHTDTQRMSWPDSAERGGC